MLSLILCLATVGLWVRSYWVSDTLVRYDNRESWDRHWWVQSESGYVLGGRRYQATNFSDSSASDRWLYYAAPPEPDFKLRYLFSVHPGNLLIQSAHWMLVILFALAPIYWLLGPWRRQEKRRKLGLCLNCGYDLRASPQRCPECGCAASG